MQHVLQTEEGGTSKAGTSSASKAGPSSSKSKPSKKKAKGEDDDEVCFYAIPCAWQLLEAFDSRCLHNLTAVSNTSSA